MLEFPGVRALLAVSVLAACVSGGEDRPPVAVSRVADAAVADAAVADAAVADTAVADTAAADAPDGLVPGDAAIPSDAGQNPAPGPITLATLFEEYTDLRRLMRAPGGESVALLASTYDRQSQSPDREGWFSNWDASGAMRMDGDQRVLLETEGAGVISRIWSPNPSGRLRIFLDGASTPVIDAPFANLLRGDVPPFVPPFAFAIARGANLIYPIPFARSARVTLTAPNVYVMIDHRMYRSPGVAVETFAPGAPQASPARDRAAAALRGEPSPCVASTHSGDLTPEGEPFEIRLPGGGVVQELIIESGGVARAALARATLAVTFDDEARPSVNAPLLRLFAYPENASAVAAQLIFADDRRFALRLPMPFARRVRVALRSPDPSLRLRARAVVAPHPFGPDTLYLNARWTGVVDADVARPRDWRVAMLRGAGWYVGTVLNVTNPSPWWWGEGDHKVFVDGEAFPSHFGTGTEDYFAYGWCSTQRFTTALYGQTRANRRDNGGRTTLYRFHTVDAIPFERSLAFDFELWHWGSTGMAPVPLHVDAVYFFYARPGVVLEAPVSDAEPSEAPLPAGAEQTSGAEVYACG